jgi:hypothetical protein
MNPDVVDAKLVEFENYTYEIENLSDENNVYSENKHNVIIPMVKIYFVVHMRLSSFLW